MVKSSPHPRPTVTVHYETVADLAEFGPGAAVRLAGSISSIAAIGFYIGASRFAAAADTSARQPSVIFAGYVAWTSSATISASLSRIWPKPVAAPCCSSLVAVGSLRV